MATKRKPGRVGKVEEPVPEVTPSAEALKHGPKGGSALEKYHRDSEIYRAHLRGIGSGTLAATYGVTEDTVRTILREQQREIHRTAAATPLEILNRHLAMLDAAIEELATTGASMKGAARTASIRARVQTLNERLQAQQEAGLVPHDLGTIGVQINVAQIGRDIAAVLAEEDVPTEVIKRVALALDPAVGSVNGTATEIEEDDE